jgi:DNA topoisomerase I
MDKVKEIKLSRRKLRSITSDNRKSAKAAQLVYVNDQSEGIVREKQGESFLYLYKGTEVDEETLWRCKRLVLPPAWKNVWICPNPDGHLQATGMDARGRKQYKYHPLWTQLRNHTKFFNLHDLGLALPAIRQKLQKDLSRQGMPQEKVLAAVISLMQCTCIRIGNSAYEKLYGSFGLTTLKDRHVSIHGSKLNFAFKGKKGVMHNVTLKSRKLAKIVQHCKDIPGKELFQYIDDNGDRKGIDSGMVNNYIKEVSGGNFTAKDFRTWAGSLEALRAFNEIGDAETEAATKRNINTALDMVAKQLGNTRAVCRKYYVHPTIIDLYSNHQLSKYLRKIHNEDCVTGPELSAEEKVLMKILEGSGAALIAA